MIDMFVEAWVVDGKEIIVEKILDEDCLMEVEVVVGDCSMNIHTRFGTHHR